MKRSYICIEEIIGNNKLTTLTVFLNHKF